MTTFSASSGSAEGKDLVFISETIGSGSVVFDDDGDGVGTFVLKDTDVRIIRFEAYMYEDVD